MQLPYDILSFFIIEFFFQKLKNYPLKFRFGIKLINYAVNNTVLQLRDKKKSILKK